MNPDSSPLILALDVGTSSTRAILFDAQGDKIGAASQIEYSQTTTFDGGVETDADVLLERTAQCIDALLKTTNAQPTAVQPTAVACSCFWHSLMAIDEGDKPLTPLFSWADNRAAPWIPALRATLNEEETHARTGCVFHTSYWPAKLLWLHHTRPELFASSTRWISFGEYLALKLCGTARSSLSMASGTGLFNQNHCDWDEPTLAALPIARENLPELCDANEPLGDLRQQWKTRWPQLSLAKWFPALGDGACSNIGSGCTSPDKIALNVGTSGALRVVLNDYKEAAPTGLWRYRIDRKRVLMGGALSNGGVVYAWAKKNLLLPDDAEAQIAQLQPDAHGLTVLPFLAGERSPLWNANARLAIEGASLDTTPTEILQACLEASALRFAAVAQLLFQAVEDAESSTRSPDSSGFASQTSLQIVASGGALSHSPVWTRILCDCLGVPLLMSQEAEASARGAALMALESCGIIKDVSELPAEEGETHQPDAAHHQTFVRALSRQNALYQKLYGAAH